MLSSWEPGPWGVWPLLPLPRSLSGGPEVWLGPLDQPGGPPPPPPGGPFPGAPNGLNSSLSSSPFAALEALGSYWLFSDRAIHQNLISIILQLKPTESCNESLVFIAELSTHQRRFSHYHHILEVSIFVGKKRVSQSGLPYLWGQCKVRWTGTHVGRVVLLFSCSSRCSRICGRLSFSTFAGRPRRLGRRNHSLPFLE